MKRNEIKAFMAVYQDYKKGNRDYDEVIIARNAILNYHELLDEDNFGSLCGQFDLIEGVMSFTQDERMIWNILETAEVVGE